MVIAIFHTHEGDVLLQNRGEGEELWAFLGGGVEEGEEPLQALVREMQEEVGFLIDHTSADFKYLSKYEVPFSEERVIECHFYKLLFPGFEVFSDSDEVKVSELKLFTTDQLKAINRSKVVSFYLDNVFSL